MNQTASISSEKDLIMFIQIPVAESTQHSKFSYPL